MVWLVGLAVWGVGAFAFAAVIGLCVYIGMPDIVRFATRNSNLNERGVVNVDDSAVSYQSLINEYVKKPVSRITILVRLI